METGDNVPLGSRERELWAGAGLGPPHPWAAGWLTCTKAVVCLDVQDHAQDTRPRSRNWVSMPGQVFPAEGTAAVFQV